MIRNQSRSFLFASLLTLTPWLFGADGTGCGRPQPPVPVDRDASTCVSHLGDHCGGNIQNACSCAADLACTLGDAGLPFGDVGGTCQKPEPLPEATDAGACVSDEGGHCGGNTRFPCSCAAGLDCTPHLGGPAPGDVGGTCEKPKQPDVDGGACVSDEGGRCGGNTRFPCSCASGLVCTPEDAGTLIAPPGGDVGGMCRKPKP
jgi:hypothetical protein